MKPMLPHAPGGKRPVIVRLRNWVGDVVLGLPALQALSDAGFEPVLLGRGPWLPALFRGTPWRVLVQPKGLRARVSQLRALRHEALAIDPGFNARPNALVLPQSFSSALELRLAGLRAVGYRHEGRGFLLHRHAPLPVTGHVAQHYLDAVALFLRASFGDGSASPIATRLPLNAQGQLSQPTLPVSEDARHELQAQLQAQGLTLSECLVLCPFAGGKSANAGLDKSWPHFEAFAQAASVLGRPLLIYPGPGEVEQARARFPSAIVIEGSRMDHYAALLQGAALVLAIDTGPGHLAAAVGGRLLSLIGPTIPEHWRPLGPKVELITGYPAWPTIDEVLGRVRAALGGAA